MSDENPILDEIHAVRETIAREHDYDVGRIVRWVQENEKRHNRVVVNLPPRSPVVVRKVG